jgi:excisionase family DNA binding protein
MSAKPIPRTIPDPAIDPTIRAERAAAILDISLRHAYAAIERGEIPSVKIGTSVRIPTAKFLAAFGLGEQDEASA